MIIMQPTNSFIPIAHIFSDFHIFRIQLEASLEEEKTNVSNLDNAKKSETEKLMSELDGLRVELDEKNRVATEMSKFEEEIRVNGKNGLNGKLREDFDRIIDEHKQELEKKYLLDKEELHRDKERHLLELQEEKKKIQDDVENEKKKMKEEIDKERRKSDEIVRKGSSDKTGHSIGYSFSQNPDEQQSGGYRSNETQHGERYGQYSASEQRQQKYNQENREQGTSYQNQQDDRRYQSISVDQTNQETSSSYPIVDYRQPNDSFTNSYYSQREGYTTQDQVQDYQLPDFQCMGDVSANKQDYGRTGGNPNSSQQNTGDYSFDFHMTRDRSNAGTSYSKSGVYSNQGRDHRDDLDFHLSSETSRDQPRQRSSKDHYARSPSGGREDKPNQFYVSPGSENELRSQINQLRSENEGLKAKIEAMEENISLHKRYKEEAKDELNRLQKTKEELQTKLNKGGQDSDEARRAIIKADKLEKSLLESETRRKEFEAKIKELNHKLNDAEEKARQAKEKTGDLEDKIRGRSKPSGENINGRSYGSKDYGQYSRVAPVGEVTALDSSPLYQDSNGGHYGKSTSGKDRPRQLHNTNTGLQGGSDSNKDRSHRNVYGYPDHLSQTVGCLESNPGRDDGQHLSWKQTDIGSEKYSKTSPYSSKGKSAVRHGLSSSPNPLHGSHERLGRSHYHPQETGHKVDRYSSFSAANEPGYNTSSPRKPDGRSYGNDGTPSRHDSTRVTKVRI